MVFDILMMYRKRQKCMSFTITDAHDRIRKSAALRHAVGARYNRKLEAEYEICNTTRM